jgi:hypothetical protein
MQIPYPGRIQRCLERLDAGGEPLVTCLCATKVLPARLEREGLASEALGRDALCDWLGDRAGGDDRSPHLLLWPLQPTVFITVGFTVYVITSVLPKLERMLRSLHVPFPVPLQLLAETMASKWIPLLAPFAIIVAVLVFNAYLAGWLPGQLAAARIARGRLIIRAAWSGVSERAMADALARSFWRPPGSLDRAGEAGDLVGIMRACGWRARGTDELAQLVERVEARRHVRQARRMTAIKLLAPVILAIPVLLLACLTFWMLATITHVGLVDAGHQDLPIGADAAR